ncbi:MAG: hypothetical protein ACP5KD_07130 [Fervidobacterium sp.]
MTEPISGVQNQTIILKVGYENSHIVSLQQYTAQAALMQSAQSVEKRIQQELTSPKSVNSTEQKKIQSSTEGKSQGEYTKQSKQEGKEKKDIVRRDDSHILDVRV